MFFFNQPRWDDDGLRIRTVQKQQVIAKVLLRISAIKTFSARRRVRDNNSISDTPFLTFDFGRWTLDF